MGVFDYVKKIWHDRQIITHTDMNRIEDGIEGLGLVANKSSVPDIATMVSMKKLALGDVVELNGYYTAGDGAGHKRKVEEVDDGSGVQLANGLWANIVHDGEIKSSWLGSKTFDVDAIFDNAIIFNKINKIYSKSVYNLYEKENQIKFIFPVGIYKMNNAYVNSHVGVKLEGMSDGFKRNNLAGVIFAPLFEGQRHVLKIGGIENNDTEDPNDSTITGKAHDYYSHNGTNIKGISFTGMMYGKQNGKIIKTKKTKTDFLLRVDDFFGGNIEKCWFSDNNGSGIKLTSFWEVDFNTLNFTDIGSWEVGDSAIVIDMWPKATGIESSSNNSDSLFRNINFELIRGNFIRTTSRSNKNINLNFSNIVYECCRENDSSTKINSLALFDFAQNESISFTNVRGSFLGRSKNNGVQQDTIFKFNNNAYAFSAVGISTHHSLDFTTGESPVLVATEPDTVVYGSIINVTNGYVGGKQNHIVKNNSKGFLKVEEVGFNNGYTTNDIPETLVELEKNMSVDDFYYSTRPSYLDSLKIIEGKRVWKKGVDNVLSCMKLPTTSSVCSFIISGFLVENEKFEVVTYDKDKVFKDGVSKTVDSDDLKKGTLKINIDLTTSKYFKILQKTDLGSSVEFVKIKEIFSTGEYIDIATSKIKTNESFSENLEVKIPNNANFCDVKPIRMDGLSVGVTGQCSGIASVGQNDDLGFQIFKTNLGRCFIRFKTGGVFKNVEFTTVSLVDLNTPYHATKMQQEGVYEDFIQYMDEKTEYDRMQRGLEQQHQLAFEQSGMKNYEEWLAEQPIMLPVIEEPQPSEKLLAFKEKYLG